MINEYCSDLNRKDETKTIIRACDGEDGALIPSNLLFSVWNYVDYLVGYAQQDAHEFLIALITCLEAQLVSSNTSSSLSSNTSFPLNQVIFSSIVTSSVFDLLLQ